jgi:transketolase
MRPAVRLASIMKQRVIFIYTHDSIGLGEDGPTHQPIEQLSALWAIPNIIVMRPADANETAEAWKFALKHTDGPTCLVLTRQKLGFIDRTKFGAADGVQKGGYILEDSPDGKIDVVLMSSGSEVAITLGAAQKLISEKVNVRVVSLPSLELFERQSAEYQESVLPPGVPRVSIEAGSPMSWYKLVGSNGVAIGIERFGASAPYETIYTKLGVTVDKVVEAAHSVIGKTR